MRGNENRVTAVGNSAAMRDALENSNGLLEELAVIGEWGESAREQIAENNAALSAPERNCDVGTAEEQGERQKAYCRKHFTPDKLGGNCRKCPLKNRRGWSCQLAWAQMPYDAEEGAGE